MYLYNSGKFCVTVYNFMANHNNRIIGISSIFGIIVISLEFGDGKLAIEFAIELERLCFLCNCLMVG